MAEMSPAPPTGRYSVAQIAVHWLTFVLVLANWAMGQMMDDPFEARLDGTLGPFPGNPHVWLGLAILILTFGRLRLRARQGHPPIPDHGSDLLRLAALWSHRLLYALLVAVPLVGGAAWFLPSERAGDLHGAGIAALVILILVHVAAALFHQFVLRDEILARITRPPR